MTGFDSLTSGVTDEQYHADYHSLSSTGARKLLACPARFKWDRDHPSTASKALDFGKIAHTLILGEGGSIAVIDAPDWRTKAAQAERDSARESGATPVLKADYEAAQAMRDAVMAHSTAAALFADGVAELSGWWLDDDTDVTLRFRPDWLTTLDDQPVCVDLKTTVNADPSEFVRSVAKFGYHAQAAWYLRGLEWHGIPDARFLFVCVEKAAPYPVSVIELDADALAEGAWQNRQAINLYRQCLDADYWPAYGTQIHTISLPPWATRGSTKAEAQALINELEGITA